jgi:hypothetical protein
VINGRTALRAFFFSFFLFASSSLAGEAIFDAGPPSLLSGPDGQMRILIPLPLSGACDVLWCTDPKCSGGCTAKWPLLTSYFVEMELDGEKASRRIELSAFPVTTFWDPKSVSWNSPWKKQGGDLFLPRKWRDSETIAAGKKKKPLSFPVIDAVREVSRERLTIYGFALTSPIPEGSKESEAGIPSQDVDDLGKILSVRIRLVSDVAFGAKPAAD